MDHAGPLRECQPDDPAGLHHDRPRRTGSNAEIRLFAVFEESKLAEEEHRMYDLIETGQLPISRNNIDVLCRQDNTDSPQRHRPQVRRGGPGHSWVFATRRSSGMKGDLFAGYEEIGNVLFVNATEEVQDPVAGYTPSRAPKVNAAASLFFRLAVLGSLADTTVSPTLAYALPVKKIPAPAFHS